MKKVNPDMHGQLLTPAHANQFVLAGNATVTLISQKSNTRFTYRVRQSDDGRVWFVQMLTGPDNENSYRYLGHFRGDKMYVHGRKSRFDAESPGAKAFDWFANWALEQPAWPAGLQVWHEGRCGRCGRKLTVPESIARGIGPECWGLMGLTDSGEGDEARMHAMEAAHDRMQSIAEERAKRKRRAELERQ